MSAKDLEWKVVRVRYPASKRRTPRDAVGTAYAIGSGILYVKIAEDRWLCFRGRSLDACLDAFARTPGAGATSNDDGIGGAISTDGPRDPEVRTTVLPALRRGKRAPPLSAKQTPDEIWRGLEARGAQIVRRPVTAKEIAAAEKALGVRLPASYVELVRRHGAPAFGDPVRTRAPADALRYAVLTPNEVVRRTRKMRKVSAEMFEEPGSLERVGAQLARAVLFQLQREPVDGYVFLLDTLDAAGEMRVADFAHDYIEELDWRPRSRVVFRSLSAATLHVAKQIARDLP